MKNAISNGDRGAFSVDVEELDISSCFSYLTSIREPPKASSTQQKVQQQAHHYEH